MPRFTILKHEGWAVYHSNPSIDTENRSWQCFISVKPEMQNLKKALAVMERLANNDEDLMKYRHPIIKVALPVNAQEHSHYFDVTMPPPLTDMAVCDQDQMGKEIILTMDYDTSKKSYLYDPSKYKTILLRIWKALEEGGVELNYITPDQDDIPVNCDEDIATPFSYCARKLRKEDEDKPELHGLLFSKDANPFNFEDPLDGVKIRKEDLSEFNINGGEFAVVCYKRIDFMNQRVYYARYSISEEVKRLIKAAEEVPNCNTVLKSINQLLKIDDANQFFQQSLLFFKNDMDKCKKYLPHISNGKLSPIFTDTDVNNCLKEEDPIQKSQKLRELLARIQKNVESESYCIARDFKENPYNLPEDAIYKVPFMAQCLFRRIIHLQNCNQRLDLEQTNLLNYRFFPSTYEKIWQQEPGNCLKKARAILADYTQDGNYFSLLLKFHINRSPTQIDRVQKILSNYREITKVKTLMSRLKEIPLKDSGSLGKRLAFIMKKYYEYKLEKNEKKLKLTMK